MEKKKAIGWLSIKFQNKAGTKQCGEGFQWNCTSHFHFTLECDLLSYNYHFAKTDIRKVG